MNGRYYFFLFLIFVSSWLFANDILVLTGNLSQGGLVFGTVNSDVEKIFWNYQEIPLDKNRFIVGFDRDEKRLQVLTIVLKNGKIMERKFFLQKRKYDIQKIERVPKKYVEKPTDKNLMRRISNEKKSLSAVRSLINSTKQIFADSFLMPVKNGKITGVFGSQRILNGIPQKPHNGLDIAAPEGTEVLAAAAGKVVLTGDYFYNGKFVLIDHGGGLNSIYIHLKEIDVEIGQFVRQGDKIGEVGSSGRSTGPHLHWGVNWKGKRIDPELLLKKNFITEIASDSE